jgi:CrcB protein
VTLPDDPDLAAPPDTARPFALVLLVAVAVGGVVGALARDGLTRAVAAPAGGFPWATFAINLSGSLLLGLLVGALVTRPGAPRWLRPLLGTGVLGGYTTFSTFAVETDRLVSLGHADVAAGYAVATLVLGAVLSGLGLWLGERTA